MRHRIFLVPAICVLSGCASVGTMDTPHTTRRGETEVAVTTYSVHYQLDEGDKKIQLTLPVQELVLRRGISERWDLGIRLNSGAGSLETRFQAIHAKYLLLTLGAGFNYSSARFEFDNNLGQFTTYNGLFKLSAGVDLWRFTPYVGGQLRAGIANAQLRINGEDKIKQLLPTDLGALAGAGLGFRLTDDLSIAFEYQAGFRPVPIRQLAFTITLGRNVPGPSPTHSEG